MAATLSSEHFDNLQLLLKAPSKDFVKDVCVQSRRGPSLRLTRNAAAALAVPEAQAAQLLHSLHALSAHVVFRNLSSAERVVQLFPEGFHSSLKNLLTKILLENREMWKTEAVRSQNGGRVRLRFRVDGGAEQGESGHRVGRAGPRPGPALCGRWQVMTTGCLSLGRLRHNRRTQLYEQQPDRKSHTHTHTVDESGLCIKYKIHIQQIHASGGESLIVSSY
ncbi:COMM domain-containing protein 9 isoform X1 [Phycodurus eques]|uniref:COMM domain-containing protein 9 isoform X1 n=1 Tax=Phycodurus eques TaxID=693459 RepID=UPI002ACE354D|nr:COMM domain-containing protein 9 isoform X1 [Phycodurus eques]